MLAYKIVVGVMFSANIVLQTLKTAQAVRYKQRRLAIINASALVIAAGMLVWTLNQ